MNYYRMYLRQSMMEQLSSYEPEGYILISEAEFDVLILSGTIRRESSLGEYVNIHFNDGRMFVLDNGVSSSI